MCSAESLSVLSAAITVANSTRVVFASEIISLKVTGRFSSILSNATLINGFGRGDPPAGRLNSPPSYRAANGCPRSSKLRGTFVPWRHKLQGLDVPFFVTPGPWSLRDISSASRDISRAPNRSRSVCWALGISPTPSKRMVVTRRLKSPPVWSGRTLRSSRSLQDLGAYRVLCWDSRGHDFLKIIRIFDIPVAIDRTGFFCCGGDVFDGLGFVILMFTALNLRPL